MVNELIDIYLLDMERYEFTINDGILDAICKNDKEFSLK